MCPVQRAVGSEAKDDMTEVMSDKVLLDALDLGHPGLESVCEAMSAADLGEAKQRLINYFSLVTASSGMNSSTEKFSQRCKRQKC